MPRLTQPELIRVAGVILYRDGKVLLQHRDDRPDIVYPGAWAFFGGHLEPGETPEEGAKREILEELELELNGPLELVHHGVNATRERFIYAAPLDRDPSLLVVNEGQGAALFTREELALHPVVPAHRVILERDFHYWPDSRVTPA